MHSALLMPWGKYAKQRLSEIPAAYLDYLVQQEWMQENHDLLQQIIEHLESRPDWDRQTLKD